MVERERERERESKKEDHGQTDMTSVDKTEREIKNKHIHPAFIELATLTFFSLHRPDSPRVHS